MVQFACGCHHSRLSTVFTIKHRTYQVCLECGREFGYSWELMHCVQLKATERHAPLNSSRHAEVSVI
jgi:hypothetical protein